MRLKSIKLAGFKSFVDPTTVVFPGNLTAIVGPNGCGKSNVIDAVRWVMGESSAKHLRGEALTDVIFNGSGTRKPTAQASIELLFDNTDRRITGEYAGFDEIAIRRVVSRDGQSAYFLNGTRCRRRDITDIFLGTGLGPRSYSIIEQGMISRVVEARPEELRAHLEEAAGISKYKERRRETENRMRHTRENIERLDDLRGELDTQLRRLDRQAKAAVRYRELQAEEREARRALLALRWQRLSGAVEALDGRIGDARVRVEKTQAEVRRLEAEVERVRDEQATRQEAVNNAQSRAYELGADVARLEDALRLRRQRVAELAQERTGILAQQEQLEAALEQDRSELEARQAEQARLAPELEQVNRTLGAAEQEARAAEEAQRGWQARWDELGRALREPERRSQVESTRVGQLELQLERLSERRERLGRGHAEAIEELDRDLQEARRDWERAHEAQTRLEEAQAAAARAVRAARSELEARRTAEAEARRALDALRAQRSGLEALQREALGQSEAVSRWLEDRGLAGAPRLVERLVVREGWQRAVETALGPQLAATCVDDLGVAARELPGEGLFLVEAGAAPDADHAALAAQVEDRFGMGDLLANLRPAPDLAEALAQRHALAPGERFVTPDGVLVGRNALSAPGAAAGGVIARQATLDRLGAEIEAAAGTLRQAEAARSEAASALEAAEADRDRAAEALRRASAEAGERRSAVSRLEVQRETLVRQEEARVKELRELETQQEQETRARAEAAARVEAADAEIARYREALDALARDRDALSERVRLAEKRVRELREQSVQLALRERQVTTQLEALAVAAERLRAQREGLAERLEHVDGEAAAADAPIEAMAAELESALQRRRESEGLLTEARQAQGRVDERLRGLLGERDRAAQAVEAAREALEALRLERQGEDTRRAGVAEQLAEAGVEDVASVLEALESEASESALAEQLDAVARRIQRLGPINLAAIEEFEQESERKAYLDAQHQDLTQALETLESAIRKIDRETRARFSSTFETVNSGLKALFPKVFGGGEAYLELTGDDLLTTGVSIMARPPGKRNASIHLLSGGEKAMVAVALVLAIFRLNPAPFCMLDEVDAPLDDANVFRYAELLREMSQEIQFIFITHNKVSMERADHLMGVTMQEAGVSRIVSVNVEEAAAMAAG